MPYTRDQQRQAIAALLDDRAAPPQAAPTTAPPNRKTAAALAVVAALAAAAALHSCQPAHQDAHRAAHADSDTTAAADTGSLQANDGHADENAAEDHDQDDDGRRARAGPLGIRFVPGGGLRVPVPAAPGTLAGDPTGQLQANNAPEGDTSAGSRTPTDNGTAAGTQDTNPDSAHGTGTNAATSKSRPNSDDGETAPEPTGGVSTPGNENGDNNEAGGPAAAGSDNDDNSGRHGNSSAASTGTHPTQAPHRNTTTPLTPGGNDAPTGPFSHIRAEAAANAASGTQDDSGDEHLAEPEWPIGPPATSSGTLPLTR